MSDEKVAVATAPPSRPSVERRSEKTSLEHKSDASHKDVAAPVGAVVQDSDPELRAWIDKFESRNEATVEAANKTLVRKMDLHLLPCLIFMYLLNFLDRANLAQARQGSLEADLGMTGSDFNLATSIFFVAYLLMQLPSNLLITRVRPSIYLTTAMALWGAVSACNAATRKFGDLIAVRFILGFVEAPFFPGAVFLMSSWYTRAELTRRMSLFYSGNALANMFGGIIGAAVLGNMDGAQGIAGWRWLFIIEGVVTIAFAGVAAFILPDYPRTTRWLSEEERAFAQWRLLRDINETDEPQSIWVGLKLALTDYRLYLFVLLQHLSLLSQTFQYFFPSIVQTLGYDKITTLWLTVPVWFGTFLVSVAVTFSSAKTGDRSLHIFGLMMVAAVGNAIATGTNVLGARFFAMFLMPMGAVPACKPPPPPNDSSCSVTNHQQIKSSSHGSPTRSPAPSSSVLPRLPLPTWSETRPVSMARTCTRPQPPHNTSPAEAPTQSSACWLVAWPSGCATSTSGRTRSSSRPRLRMWQTPRTAMS